MKGELKMPFCHCFGAAHENNICLPTEIYHAVLIYEYNSLQAVFTEVLLDYRLRVGLYFPSIGYDAPLEKHRQN
jgi:hypothetical protein